MVFVNYFLSAFSTINESCNNRNMTKNNHKKMPLRPYRVESNTGEQQTDIIKPTDESHLALQILTNYSLFRSEVDKQLLSGVYLDVQYCLDSLQLELQYCRNRESE